MATIAGSCGLCLAASAWAQTPPPATAPATAPGTTAPGAGSLENIVVTARKRSEKLQDVPLQVTALSAVRLQQDNIVDLQGILSQTPGATLYSTNAGAYATPVIRGQFDLNYMGLTDGTPNVATFLDGIYLQNNNATSLALMDMARVEVVEGPESALYGRTAFAGLINYVSKKPTDDLDANLLQRFSQYGTYQTQFDVNGPIVPGILKAGIGGNFETSDGAFKDSETGARAGGYDKKDIKGEFDFTPIEHLDITGGFYVGKDDYAQDPLVQFNPNCGTPSAGIVGLCGLGVPQPIQIGNIPAASGNSGNDRRVALGHFKVDYDLGFGDISYLFGYNHVQDTEFEDFTGLRQGLVFPTYAISSPPGTVPVSGSVVTGSVKAYELFGEIDNTIDTSHEIRFTSRQSQPIRYSFGADTYQSSEYSQTVVGLDRYSGTVPAGSTINFAPFCAGFALCNTYFLTPSGATNGPGATDGQIGDRQYSGFGSVEFDILPNLTAGGEARTTSDKQTLGILQEDLQIDAATQLPKRYPFGGFRPAHFYFNNYRGFVRYKITPDAMLYVSVATGTKPGGFNIQGDIPANQVYQPEKNITYEGGFKTAWLNNQLILDADAYHIDSSGLQAYEPVPPFFSVISNFGGTANTGLDVSATARPELIPGLTTTAAFSYTDPKFIAGSYDYTTTAVDYASCLAEPSCAPRVTTLASGTQKISLNGLQLPGSSKETFNLTVDYRRAVTDDIDGFVHLTYRYASKQYSFGISPADVSYEGSTQSLNIKVGAYYDKNYEASLFVSNLTNNQTPIYLQRDVELNFLQGEILGQLPNPRIFGGELAIHYGGPRPAMPAPEPAPPVQTAPAPLVAPVRTYLVFFDWDRADLTARARQIVASAAMASTHVSTTRIEVDGYTDLSGSMVYNQKLSVRRARAVEDELVHDGVARSEILVRGHGESNPLVPTAVGVREPQNRRVEVVLR